MSFKTLLIGGLLTAAAGASAQLTLVGPFTGLHNEGFESFPNYTNGGNYNSLSILQGTATISDPLIASELYIYSPTNGATFGLGSNGAALVHGGVNGLALWGYTSPVDVTLTFSTAVNAFGGYFADNSSYPGSVKFYDSSHNLIGGAQSLDHSGDSMDWMGWSSTDPIQSMSFTAAPINGMIVMDDLQAGMLATPEPCTLAVLGIGAIGLLVRRKRH